VLYLLKPSAASGVGIIAFILALTTQTVAYHIALGSNERGALLSYLSH